MPHLLPSTDINEGLLMLKRRKVIDHLVTHEDFLAYYERMFDRDSSEEPDQASMNYVLREQTNGLFEAFNRLCKGDGYPLVVFTKALQDSVEDAMGDGKSLTYGVKELVRYLVENSGRGKTLGPTYNKMLEYDTIQGAESKKALSISTRSHTRRASSMTGAESVGDNQDDDSKGAPTSWACTLM